jgi:hypothetical protein
MNRQFSFEDKLNRAGQLLRNLDTIIVQWLATDAYCVIDEPDLCGDSVIRLKPLEPPPRRVAVLVGDYLYNLRSALDHLVYTLAVANLGEPLPEKIARGSEFPIFNDAISYAKGQSRKIGGIAPEAQKTIEEFQPYHARRLRSHPLWLLHELSNIDKHRAPHLAIAAHLATQPPLPFTEYTAAFKSGRLLEHETEVVRYHMSGRQKKVAFDFFVDLVFAHTLFSRRRVLATLRVLQKYIVGDILPPLRKFLPGVTTRSGT